MRYTEITMSLRRELLYTALGVLVFLAVLHFLALGYSFYWRFWWYDILTHFLGGVVVGLGALWGALLWGWGVNEQQIPVRQRLLFTTIAVALLIGISWETYELWFDLYDTEQYVLDTSLDLLMDTAGAVFAYVYAIRFKFPRVVKVVE
jgi:hypothetical protein